MIYGWYRHLHTNLCQVWLSLDRRTITLVSSHRTPQSARAAVRKIEEADEAGELADPQKLQAFLIACYEAGEKDLEPFPEWIIKDFGLEPREEQES